jgi:hypothetical protein
MKKNIVAIVFIALLIFINFFKEERDQLIHYIVTKFTSEKSNTIKAKPIDAATLASFQTRFENFKTDYQEVNQKAKIDFNSNANAKKYKSVIVETYNSEKVNFAGYYIIATWGCGTACISGVMVDVRDGKVYDLPVAKNDEIIGNDYESKRESFLLKTKTTGFRFEGNQAFSKVHYWKWNEQNKKFNYLKSAEVAEVN